MQGQPSAVSRTSEANGPRQSLPGHVGLLTFDWRQMYCGRIKKARYLSAAGKPHPQTRRDAVHQKDALRDLKDCFAIAGCIKISRAPTGMLRLRCHACPACALAAPAQLAGDSDAPFVSRFKTQALRQCHRNQPSRRPHQTRHPAHRKSRSPHKYSRPLR